MIKLIIYFFERRLHHGRDYRLFIGAPRSFCNSNNLDHINAPEFLL